MLEVKNLLKIYKTKGGAEVRAVDDVSVAFNEKGMVFLLGKSGSGKSTLLNLCGGLDSPDGGEIVVKGRSSKDFTRADFDSYRNTFVGFVFQEYNILDEFSVEDNIALALELQGKNKDRAAVAEILSKVDLTDFAKRKPNTLSGGQKQRVAIARALVKNPEIILADEPTGALDSATGKQVLDILKKLSQDKLVIIVSHDREFAEQYGDRIIELKDGKIISDVTKTKIAATKTSENVSFIGNDTVSVKDGSALTDEDMKKIRSFLSSKSGNIVIASGDKEVSAYKKVAKIEDDGAKESFRNTEKADVPEKKYGADDSKLIRSKLPLKHAVKIGASGLKVKPFRLFFTILLSFIAFAMFGLFSTLTFYDKTSTAVESYKQSDYDYLFSAKKYNSTTTYYANGEKEGSSTTSYYTRFTPEELEAAKQKYGDVYGAYNFSSDKYSISGTIRIANSKALNYSYYSTDVKMFVEVPSGRKGFELLTDTDMSALGSSDVVISSYLFDSLKYAGLFDGLSASGGYVTLINYDDIIGKQLALSGMSSGVTVVTVKGVYRADPPEKFVGIKNDTEPEDSALSSAYRKLIDSGMYSMLLVSPDFYDAHLTLTYNGSSYFDYSKYSLHDYMELRCFAEDGSETAVSFSYVAPYNETTLNGKKAVFFNEGQTTLSEREVLLPFASMSPFLYPAIEKQALQQRNDAYNAEYDKTFDLYEAKYSDEIEEYRHTQYQNYINFGYSPELAEEKAESDAKYYTENLITNDDPSFFNRLNTIASDAYNEFNNKAYGYLSLVETGFYNENGISIAATTEDFAKALEYLWQFGDPAEIASKAMTVYESSGAATAYSSLKCAGYTYGGTFISMIYTDQSTFESLYAEYGNKESQDQGDYYSVENTKYKESANAKYICFVLPFPEDKVLTSLLDDENAVAEDESFSVIATPLSEQLAFVNQLVSSLEKVFLWVGVVMALFSMLLLFNFISVSIANKKKEIGILRAVGARSTDIFRIFYSESAIIAVICYALAMIACFVICPILNTTIAAALGASIFVFGPISWLIMLAIAVFTSVIATFLPVYSIARKKPVESIRAL